MSTYRVIRCPGCHQFTYTDQFTESGSSVRAAARSSRWSVFRCIWKWTIFPRPRLLIKEVELYLYRSGRLDLTPAEVSLIREKYLAWLRAAV